MQTLQVLRPTLEPGVKLAMKLAPAPGPGVKLALGPGRRRGRGCRIRAGNGAGAGAGFSHAVCVLLTTQNSPLPCRPPPFPYSITSAPLALQEEARGRSLKGWAYSPLGGPEAPRVQWLGQIISLARLHRGVRGFAGRAT